MASKGSERKALAFDRFLADAAAPLAPVRQAVASEIAAWLRSYAGNSKWQDEPEVQHFVGHAVDYLTQGAWEDTAKWAEPKDVPDGR